MPEALLLEPLNQDTDMTDNREQAVDVHSLSSDQIEAVVRAAHDPIIVRNALTREGGYSPYCMRCTGFVRMRQSEPLLWTHSCGAVHDERAAFKALRIAPREDEKSPRSQP